MRAATVKWWAKGITLETTDIADADLTAIIASQSGRFDRETGDHFEAETAATVVCDGEGEMQLWVPKRIRAVTSVTVIYPGGATIAVPSTSYRPNEIFTGDFSQISHGSHIDLLPGLTIWGDGWPCGTQNVSVAGDFSWPTCPDEVKRAVALMVYDVVFPEGDILRRAQPTGYADPQTQPTGIPEVDGYIALFRRPGRY